MKFKSKEEFITEAERRGLKEGVAFRGAWQVEGNPIEFSKPWNWHEFYFDSGGDSVYSLCSRINDGYRVWIYDEGVWATPLETPLEDRVKALEDEIKYLRNNKEDKDFKTLYIPDFEDEVDPKNTRYVSFCSDPKPTQSSRHFIMEGIIEKIYPKDKEKALEALVNVARMELGNLDREKMHGLHHEEIRKSRSGVHYLGNSFIWGHTKQGSSYWSEIHDLLK